MIARLRRGLLMLACAPSWCSRSLVVGLPGLVQRTAAAGGPDCPIFPANNPWNQRVDGLPVAKDSAA